MLRISAGLITLAFVCLPSRSSAKVPSWAAKPMATKAAQLQAAGSKYAPLASERTKKGAAKKGATSAPWIGDGEDKIVLWSNVELTFAADGSSVLRTHRIERVLTERGVQDLKTLETYWSSWFQDKPTVAARVVDTSGRAHPLDPSALNVMTGRVNGDTYSDVKRLIGPLSGIEVGAIVETLVEQKSRAVSMHMGDVHSLWLASGAPIIFMQRRVKAPASMPLASVVRGSKLKPKTRKSGGTKILEVTAKNVVFKGYLESLRPVTAHDLPQWKLATGKSWQAVAQKYYAVVQKQLAGSGLKAQATVLTNDATTIEEKVDRILGFIRRELRYTSVALGNAAVVPRTPSKTLSRRFGDCKDLSTLMVGMLAEVGVKADVALLKAGGVEDISPGAPGMAQFNHAIVRVRTPKGDLWVDPTAPAFLAGTLPSGDQRRLALIAAPETTALVTIPPTTDKANGSHETLQIGFNAEGRNTLSGRYEMWGDYSPNIRARIERDRRGLEKRFQESFDEQYGLKKPAVFEFVATNPAGRSTYTWKTKDANWALIEDTAELPFNQLEVLEDMPRVMRSGVEDVTEAKPDETTKQRIRRERFERWRSSWVKRQHPLVLPEPHHRIKTIRIQPPPGFSFERPPRSTTVKMGAGQWSRTVKKWGNGGLEVRFEFVSGRSYSPEQVRSFMSAAKQLATQGRLVLKLSLTDVRRMERGQVVKGLQGLRRLYEKHRDLPEYGRHYINGLLQIGLGMEARMVAKAVVARHPSDATAWLALGNALRHDELGRLLTGSYDRKGAIAAYRKTMELKPEWGGPPVYLMELFQVGSDGLFYGPGSDALEVIRLSRHLEKHSFDAKLTERLAAAIRGTDLSVLSTIADELSKSKDAKIANVGRFSLVAVTAIKDGPQAAMKRSRAFGKPDETALGAVSILLIAGRYRLAHAIAKLIEPRLHGAKQFVTMTAPYLADSVKYAGACKIAVKAFAGFYGGDLPSSFFAKDFPLPPQQWQRTLRRGVAQKTQTSFPIPLQRLGVLVERALRCEVTGTTKHGSRLRITGVDGTAIAPSDVFVLKEKGKLRFLTLADAATWPLVHAAWNAHKRGDLASAKTWLGWVMDSWSRIPAARIRQSFPLAPLVGWMQGQPITNGDVPLITAVFLADTPHAAKSVKILTAAAKAEKDPLRKAQLQVNLTIALTRLKRSKEVHAVAQTLLKSAIVQARGAGLAALHGLAHATQKASDYLEVEKAGRQLVKEPELQRSARQALHSALAFRGAFKESSEAIKPIVEAGRADLTWVNNDLWQRLVDGRDLKEGLDHFSRLTNDGKKASTSGLHTMACVEAMRKKFKNAVKHLHSSANGEDAGPNEFFVVGLIADEVGLKDAARRAFTKALKDSDRGASSVHAIATARLKKLGPAKP